MSRVKRKEDVFYGLFREYGQKLEKVGEVYLRIFKGYPETRAMVSSMKEYENICDDQARRIFMELSSSFITPFDRDDISALTKRLDDIVDYMEAAASRLDLFAIEDMRPEGVQLAEITVTAISQVSKVLDNLSGFKRNNIAMETALAVDVTEDEGDAVYKNALADLFHGDVPTLEIMKWSRVFDRMELALNACEHACDIVQGIIMKNA
ncbi:MAG: DUF47 family protein [Atopobiaceae bacterium]|nr:DUF47 family protein [Atopobiaceae bacterium]